MAKAQIIIYEEQKGQAPLLRWLDRLPSKVQDKCIVKVELLGQYGHELKRPHCDYLENGIYELRVRHGNVHYRILYAFTGKNVVLLSHGCTKEKRVPKSEIKRAIKNRDSYVQDPKAHTYIGEL